MISLRVETRKGSKCQGDQRLFLNGELITIHDLLLLVKRFNENELRIINAPDGPKHENGSVHVNWFARALKLIADNILSFDEICQQCCVPKKTNLQIVEPTTEERAETPPEPAKEEKPNVEATSP